MALWLQHHLDLLVWVSRNNMQQCEVLNILTTVLAGLGGDRLNTNLAGCSACLGKKVGHRDEQNDTKLSINETEHAQSTHTH